MCASLVGVTACLTVSSCMLVVCMPRYREMDVNSKEKIVRQNHFLPPVSNFFTVINELPYSYGN